MADTEEGCRAWTVPQASFRSWAGRPRDSLKREPAMSTSVTNTTVSRNTIRGLSARIGAAAVAVMGIATTGCQVDVGGQTLPSAYYLQDDIQYFPAGPEFKLSKEAAAQKAYKKEMAERNAGY
jgi:hypothetical protein